MAETPIWLIAGPTASGKSAIALALAHEIGGEIVNADSMQLYRDLRILTARPSAEDEAQAPHHLFGVADAAEAWSVGRWLNAALSSLKGIEARGRAAIVVGGTGLYFRALTLGLAVIPPTPATMRAKTQAEFDRVGEGSFRERLQSVDPAAAERIAAGDRQRLTRAMEVYKATGRSLTDWQLSTTPPLARASWSGIVLTLPRAELYARIETRLDVMKQAGALKEVETLMARDLDPRLPAMKALGVESFASELAGFSTPSEALAKAKAETRRYAKRQISWFNHQAADWPRADASASMAAMLTLLGGL